MAIAPYPSQQTQFVRTLACAKRLLSLGVSLDRKDRYGNTPIEAIATAGPSPEITKILRMLLEHGAEAPPWVIAAAGDLERFKAIAEYEPETARDPRSAFTAIEAGQTEMVEWMLDHGLPPDCRSPKDGKETLLHAAAWHGNLSLVKTLLARGADPTATDHEYRTTPAAWARTAFERLGRNGCDAVYRLLREKR